MDITSMSPVTGRMVKEDGSIYNIADALSDGSEPVTSQKVPIHAMSPRTGRMVREDGTIVNVAELIEELINSGGGGGGTGTTNYNDLINKPTINGVELAGNKTSADLKISADITQVDHGTSDTTFTLPPNEIHTWGEVSSLTLTLGAGTSGIVNEYLFAFSSGATPTTLSLPKSIQTDIYVDANTHYECSIVGDYMTFHDWPVEEAAT